MSEDSRMKTNNNHENYKQYSKKKGTEDSIMIRESNQWVIPIKPEPLGNPY